MAMARTGLWNPWGRRLNRWDRCLGGRVLRYLRPARQQALRRGHRISRRECTVDALESTEGIRFGDAVSALVSRPEIEVGQALMGRVLNAIGEPIDGGGCPALQSNILWTESKIAS